MEPIQQTSSWQVSVSDDVTRLRDALPSVLLHQQKPVLVLMSGLPGTGKSYFARHLTKHLDFVLLEADLLRKTLFGQPRYTRGENRRLFAACHQLTYELLNNQATVLFDATNLQKIHREPLYAISESTGAKLIIVRTEAPQQVIRDRLARRHSTPNPHNNSDADWKVYQRMRLSVDNITRAHYLIDSPGNMQAAMDQIVTEINHFINK